MNKVLLYFGALPCVVIVLVLAIPYLVINLLWQTSVHVVEYANLYIRNEFMEKQVAKMKREKMYSDVGWEDKP